MLDVCAVLFTFLNQGFRGEFFFFANHSIDKRYCILA